MSSQENLSRIQKNIVVSGILAISIASWYFLFTMDSNMAKMDMGMSSKMGEMKMDMGSKDEMKMDMGSKDEMKMDMGSKDEMKMDMGSKDEMKMDMGSKDEMKMDMGSKDEMKMDMGSKDETWLPNTYWMPPMDNNWGTNDFYQLVIMWIIMMIAMMSPSIIPTVLMFATVNKSKQKNNLQYTPTYVFYFGYLIAWILFSIGISIIQYPLHQVSLMNPMMSSINNYLSGLVLIIAGIYQLTPYKNACLDKCRSPLSLIMSNWREGNLGALRMGLGHGFYCVFCCWFLMAILLVAGVMNLYFVVALTIFVLLEKLILTPESFENTFQRLITIIPGIVFILFGIYYFVS